MQSTPLTTALQTASSSAKLSHSLLTFFKAAKQKLVNALTISSELQVRQFVNDDDVMWYAFDPKTGRQFFADSEAEMRRWIENSYHEN